jgi:hypothetical protein
LVRLIERSQIAFRPDSTPKHRTLKKRTLKLIRNGICHRGVHIGSWMLEVLYDKGKP